MSLLSLTAVRPPTYPARPTNGGRLELAPPKPGQWCYEPKYNGWRTLVHAPTGSMFNRYAQPLSIAAEFGSALKSLRKTVLKAGGTTANGSTVRPWTVVMLWAEEHCWCLTSFRLRKWQSRLG
jgi:hypothetical protein